jgi:hypothetical protein
MHAGVQQGSTLTASVTAPRSRRPATAGVSVFSSFQHLTYIDCVAGSTSNAAVQSRLPYETQQWAGCRPDGSSITVLRSAPGMTQQLTFSYAWKGFR